MLIPLQANAGPEKVDLKTTTIEDVEHMMASVSPAWSSSRWGPCARRRTSRRVYGVDLQLGGTHPNCECITLMVGNAASGRYAPVSEYLKVPFKQAIREPCSAWDNEMEPKLDRGILWKLFGMPGASCTSRSR